MTKNTICKPCNKIEAEFYDGVSDALPYLSSFIPKYFGIIPFQKVSHFFKEKDPNLEVELN
jgi:hypothetical protein